MGKVVELKRVKDQFRVPEDAMNYVRMAMYGMDAGDLAEEIGRSKSCVMAIRSGRTKWPRGETLFALLDALNIEFKLVKRNTK